LIHHSAVTELFQSSSDYDVDPDSSRHCERSEAIQKVTQQGWIASSLTLLAITETNTRTGPHDSFDSANR